MVLQLFRPPSDNEQIAACKLGDINDGISLEFEALFCGAGTATIEIPTTSIFADKIETGTLIYSAEDEMCWIVKNIKEKGTTLSISCYDLNGMLYDRITMPAQTPVAGTEGKDAISGTSEYCVKHYVDYNLINSPVIERNYPRLSVAEDRGRGIASDSYLASYSGVDDVVREICEGAKLGYKISFVPTSSSLDPVFVFDVIERTDRSADQSDNSRVIFSVGMKNITDIEREQGITASKNAIWCETGGIDGFVNAEDNTTPASWNRREEYISLSVIDAYSSEEIALAARKEIADKFAETDSLTVEAGNPLDYRTMYNLGDIVTVYNKERDLQLNSVISGVKIKRTSSEYSVSITLGQSKPKLLDGYAKASDLLSRTQRDFPPSHTGGNVSHGNIDTYQYISDNSIKYNDLTYTVEKDESGLISRIYDDDQGEFLPEISGEITDIAFHNAVFTAIAMLCGLPKPEAEDTLTDMVQYRYNTESYELSGTVVNLLNQADGEAIPLVFTGATLNADNVYIAGNRNSNGAIAYTAPNGELSECTLYMVARGATTSAQRFVQASSTYNNFGAGEGFSGSNGVWAAGAQANSTLFVSSFSILTTSVMALRHYNGALHFYVNGEYVGVCPSAAINVTAGTFWFGATAGSYFDNGGYHYYDFAFAENAHSEADVIKNSKYLLAKYNITT